ncbi:MAG: Na+/H+ antiporter subunit E [Enhygromyxa sp.]
MHSVLLFLSLMAFYVVLSGQIGSAFLMIAGVVSCLGVTLLARRLGIVDDEGVPYRWWWKMLGYAPWLMWQVIVANFEMLKLVWSPKPDIHPRMVIVKHDLRTSFGVATYMNSITLTPGTVTVDVGEDEFLVHCLTKSVADELADGEMHRRVQALEGTQPAPPQSGTRHQPGEEARS